ncbi:MAG: 3-oxoacyl-ACP synthase III [Anaerolineae bacterium]|nr:3-oxoacyl-ACP synthase III [Anaerolineae bacterium]
MRFQNVSVIGLASIDAPHRVTSADIETALAPVMERFRVPRGLLENLSGITARRFWDPETQPSEVATLAGQKAIEDAGIDPDRIGVLVNTSVSKDYVEPSVAALVHGNLKLGPHCMNFDVGNACLGFLNGMQIIANMIDMGQVDYGLVVNGEGSRQAIEATINRMLDPKCDMRTWRSQYATLTLGSGAAAMVLGRYDLHPEGHRLTWGISMAATQHSRLCLGQPDEMVTDSKRLLHAGINLSVQMRDKMVDQIRRDPNDFEEIIIHQVSQVHTDALVEAINLDNEKLLRIYPEFGNMGPVGIPAVLYKSLELGRIEKGDRIGLYGIGSGVNSMAMEVVW